MNGYSEGSPVGWDKSYPLKPVKAPTTPIYRKNSTVGIGNGNMTSSVVASSSPNKYSGNYGPRRSASQSRGTREEHVKYEQFHFYIN
jgi:hypothetical protein